MFYKFLKGILEESKKTSKKYGLQQMLTINADKIPSSSIHYVGNNTILLINYIVYCTII